MVSSEGQQTGRIAHMKSFNVQKLLNQQEHYLNLS